MGNLASTLSAVDIDIGATVLDQDTRKHLQVLAIAMRGSEQIGWVVDSGRTLGRLRERFTLRTPIDSDRYAVLTPAPRRRRYPGADFARCHLDRLANDYLRDLAPGCLLLDGQRPFGVYVRRLEGGYVLRHNGADTRYEAWELGEMIEARTLAVEYSRGELMGIDKNAAAEEFFATRMPGWAHEALYTTNYSSGELHERLTAILDHEVLRTERAATGSRVSERRRRELQAARLLRSQWLTIRDRA